MLTEILSGIRHGLVQGGEKVSELTEKRKQFLIGLERLTRETGVGIGGCGDCGSPYLIDIENPSKNSGYAFNPDGTREDNPEVMFVDENDK